MTFILKKNVLTFKIDTETYSDELFQKSLRNTKD